jgi:cytochrome c oxidase subunit 2
LLPRKPGRYRAQCAEFCGLQHAHMALDVIVETPAQYAAWRADRSSRRPRRATAHAAARLCVFMNGQCAACHAIAGTPAFGSVGPDLTRIASRATLAAGTEPNVRAWLERWIADPQGIKPGNRMPQVKLTAMSWKAVSAYLETLSMSPRSTARISPGNRCIGGSRGPGPTRRASGDG